jgi:hypothetical protein
MTFRLSGFCRTSRTLPPNTARGGKLPGTAAVSRRSPKGRESRITKCRVGWGTRIRTWTGGTWWLSYRRQSEEMKPVAAATASQPLLIKPCRLGSYAILLSTAAAAGSIGNLVHQCGAPSACAAGPAIRSIRNGLALGGCQMGRHPAQRSLPLQLRQEIQALLRPSMSRGENRRG